MKKMKIHISLFYVILSFVFGSYLLKMCFYGYIRGFKICLNYLWVFYAEKFRKINSVYGKSGISIFYYFMSSYYSQLLLTYSKCLSVVILKITKTFQLKNMAICTPLDEAKMAKKK